MIDSPFRPGKIYYPQVFLGECKYVVKEEKMPEFITDNAETSFDKENSDEETSNA